MVWDTRHLGADGRSAKLGLSKGHLRFRLQGKKLKGEWVLVRMGGKPREKQEPWLLIKHRDEFAGRRAAGRRHERAHRPQHGRDRERQGPGLEDRGRATEKKAGRARKAKAKQPLPEPPEFVPPQLATLVKEAPSGQEWLHEVKHDGYRCQLRLAGGEARVLTRNGHDWTARFRALAEAARDLSPSALIDGEAVVLDAQGVSSFARLKNALGDGPPAPIHFYAFDLLFEGGEDLRELPLCSSQAAPRSPARRCRQGVVLALQRPCSGRRPGDLDAGLPARCRGHHHQARRRPLSLGPHEVVAQGEVHRPPGGRDRRLHAPEGHLGRPRRPPHRCAG